MQLVLYAASDKKKHGHLPEPLPLNIPRPEPNNVEVKGDYRMKTLLIKTILAAILVFSSALLARAAVDIRISLPPLIVFSAPPEVVVIPETNVYVVPDLDEDVYFHNGWWWRPWEGRWYRSRNHRTGWTYYRNTPSFYKGIPPGWRDDYRGNRWKGHEWKHQRIPHQKVQKNWRTWEKNRHWEKQNHWGVQGLKPQKRPQRPNGHVQSQSHVRPQVREAAGPRQSREGRSQHPQIRQHEAPQRTNSRHEKPEREGGERPDRR